MKISSNNHSISRISQSEKRTRFLWLFFLVINCIPGLCFFFILPIGFMPRLTILIFNIGLFSILLSLGPRIGKSLWLLFPLIFLHCFQIVLLFLFGNEPISSDMFLNLITSNNREASELMGTVWWVIAVVIVIYVPALVLAVIYWRKKRLLDRAFRLRTLTAGSMVLLVSLILIFTLPNTKKEPFSLEKNVYPVNVFHNLYLALAKAKNVRNFSKTSKDFTYRVSKTPETEEPKVIVMVIGETARADNWQLYGYERETNPLLSQENNLVVFSDALTESNVTHKSVPLFLSSATPADYQEIYRRKGIAEAFREAGYRTYFFSNQVDQFLIKNLADEAEVYKSFRVMGEDGELANNPDEILLDLLTGDILNDTSRALIVIHAYGSHFRYVDRYPKEFQKFMPDNAKGPYPRERPKLINAYDNSILYTDYFLSKLIDRLKMSKIPAAMIYSSDHGEDIFDDSRNRFLHSTGIPTYYQLRVPMIMWFSDEYKERYPEKYQNSKANALQPVSTGSVFPTMLDLAFIGTKYLDSTMAITSNGFTAPERLFLDLYDQPEPVSQLNIAPKDTLMFIERGIQRR